MSLIKCPECGVEISNKAITCPNCACSISNINNRIKSKRKRIILSVVLPLFVIIAITIVVLIFMKPYFQYRRAMILYNENNYIESTLAFSKLDGYRDSETMYNKSRYMMAKQYKEKEDYKNAIYILERMDDAGSRNLLLETKYAEAMDYYSSGMLEEAMASFLKIQDYEDSAQLINNIKILKDYQGQWVNCDVFSGTEWKWLGGTIGEEREITGAHIECYDNGYKRTGNILEIQENDLYYKYSNSLESKLEIVDGYLIETYSNGMKLKYVKGTINKKGDKPSVTIEKSEKKDPSIGMTASEVRKSTWGEPTDINKHTYFWGVTEQWCYSGYRYIYFENGIVTSISE